jgi:hypothetical protein
MNKRGLTAVLTAERPGVSTRTIHRWAADGFSQARTNSTPLSKIHPWSFQWKIDVGAFEQKRREYQPAKAESEWSFSR